MVMMNPRIVRSVFVFIACSFLASSLAKGVQADPLAGSSAAQVLVSAEPLELTLISERGAPVMGFHLGSVADESERPMLVLSFCDALTSCLESLDQASDVPEVQGALKEQAASMLSGMSLESFRELCSVDTAIEASRCAPFSLSEGALSSDPDASSPIICSCPGPHGRDSKCNPDRGCNVGKKCGPFDNANPSFGYCIVSARNVAVAEE
jgi:hypothetical protein